MLAVTAALLANGIRAEFADTYSKIQNRVADSRLPLVMDLGIGATNRKHEFGYMLAAPHMAEWRRGDSIPTGGMGSVQFEVPVHNWGRRVQWHENAREDDQTQTLYDSAAGAGRSAALLPERFFFELLTNTGDLLPAIPLAPDGVAMFSATDGDTNPRFGASGGNIISSSTGVTSAADILTDFYAAVTRFLAFRDQPTGGQPLFTSEIVDMGFVVIFPAALSKLFDEAFVQKRQGLVLGTDAGTTPSNVIIDSSRNVELWPTTRLSGEDWYIALRESPKKPTFMLNRAEIRERTSLGDENNSDQVRTTGLEYVQWDCRKGAGIALPYGMMKVVDNS